MADKRQPEVTTVPHESHGNSVAAWTAVIIIALGFLLGTVAVVADLPVFYVIGAVIVVIGAVSGKVLSAMGFGISGKPGH
jgi:hypothetical protein